MTARETLHFSLSAAELRCGRAQAAFLGRTGLVARIADTVDAAALVEDALRPGTVRFFADKLLSSPGWFGLGSPDVLVTETAPTDPHFHLRYVAVSTLADRDKPNDEYCLELRLRITDRPIGGGGYRPEGYSSLVTSVRSFFRPARGEITRRVKAVVSASMACVIACRELLSLSGLNRDTVEYIVAMRYGSVVVTGPDPDLSRSLARVRALSARYLRSV